MLTQHVDIIKYLKYLLIGSKAVQMVTLANCKK